MPFLPGIPALDKFPYRTWRRIEREVRSPTSELGPGDPSGNPRLREAIARHVAATRAIHCHPDQVVITAGAHEAVSILAELLFDPGDEVITEDPGYRAMSSAFEALGARTVPVPVDACGLDVELATREAPDARLACVTPSNQFPMGVLLSMERRKLLVEWALARGAWIIEDDHDCEYRFHGAPYPAIRSLEGADERTIYVSTFTRILFPALSLGFVILPGSLVEPYKAARSIRDYPPPLLPQLTLAKFMEDGHLLRHIRHMRHIYEGRATTLRDALTHALPRTVEVPPAAAGMHLVAWLPEGLDDRHLANRAAEEGILPLPVSPFRHAPSPRGGLILGFGGSPAARLIQSAEKLSHAFA
jgi:GntR family transcriptional regulator/MocR family aminotransferase